MLSGKEKVCVQGITGRYGSFHTKEMLQYGTGLVCGVSKNPLQKWVHQVPVVASMKEAVEQYHADTTIVFVPAQFAGEAALEALEAGIEKIILITEHIPQLDALNIVRRAREKQALLIGPNSPGVIIPGVTKVGIMPSSAFRAGDTVIISRSGTLMYEIGNYLSLYSTGVKAAIGLGGDPIIGTNTAEAFAYVLQHNIKKVIVIGELGGMDEVDGITYALNSGYTGEIKVFFAGRTAPAGERMGHAGAIVHGYSGSIEDKEKRLRGIGVHVIRYLNELE